VGWRIRHWAFQRQPQGFGSDGRTEECASFRSGHWNGGCHEFECTFRPLCAVPRVDHGDGYGTLAVKFTYEDGGTQVGLFRSPDWLDDSQDDGHGGLIPADILQINNGMNRLVDYSYFEGSEPLTGTNPQFDDVSFFSDRIMLDQTKKLTGISLGPSSGSVVNVYDLLLDIEAGITSVTNWMMFE
jgi:hypothetical protein